MSTILTKEFVIISGGKLLISTKQFSSSSWNIHIQDTGSQIEGGIQTSMHTEGSRQGCAQRDPDKDVHRGIQTGMHTEGSRQGCAQRDPDKDVHRGIQTRMHTEGSRQGCAQRDPDRDVHRGIQTRGHTEGSRQGCAQRDPDKDAHRVSSHSLSISTSCVSLGFERKMKLPVFACFHFPRLLTESLL